MFVYNIFLYDYNTLYIIIGLMTFMIPIVFRKNNN